MGSKYADRYRKIGKNIARYREQANLTQQELADLVGISKSYLSKIEAPGSIKTFSLDVLFSIADVLNVDIKDLI